MRLHLHIGHGKTGSSYLQSWLACNAALMAQQTGVLYPLQSSRLEPWGERAKQGRFSMGNGCVLQEFLKQPERPRRWLRRLRQQAGVSRQQLQGVMFSFEGWTKQLDSLIDPLLPVADRWGVERVEVLLMVRDPLDHACSLYNQMVKRHGYSGTLDEWLSDYSFSARLLRALELIEKHADRLRLTVVHYGRQRSQVLQCLHSWLGFDPALAWLPPPEVSVNRSLSWDELQLMRCLNQRIGSASAPVGEAFVDRLPDVSAAVLRPSPEAIAAFAARWEEVVDGINSHLPKEAALESIEPLPLHAVSPNAEVPLFHLTDEQIHCLVDGLLAIKDCSPAVSQD